MPVSRSTCGRQPSANSRELSINLRGVPSGFDCVPDNFAGKADDAFYQSGKFADGDVAAKAALMNCSSL